MIWGHHHGFVWKLRGTPPHQVVHFTILLFDLVHLGYFPFLDTCISLVKGRKVLKKSQTQNTKPAPGCSQLLDVYRRTIIPQLFQRFCFPRFSMVQQLLQEKPRKLDAFLLLGLRKAFGPQAARSFCSPTKCRSCPYWCMKQRNCKTSPLSRAHRPFF